MIKWNIIYSLTMEHHQYLVNWEKLVRNELVTTNEEW